MDNLFEQLTAISKAHAFDIVSKQVGELKEENEKMRAALKMYLDYEKEHHGMMPVFMRPVTSVIDSIIHPIKP